MGAVSGRPQILVRLGPREEAVEALLDTGASRSLIDATYYRALCSRLGRPCALRPAPELVSITGQRLDIKGIAEIQLAPEIPISVVVVGDLPHTVVIGHDALSRHNGVVDYKCEEFRLGGRTCPLNHGFDNGGVLSLRETTGRPDVDSLLEEFAGTFFMEGTPIGMARGIPPMEIVTSGPPIAQRGYRAPFSKRQVIDEEIGLMLRDGIIRPSSSPWSSPVLLVPKKDGSTRFCVDYRRINSVTRKDRYPLPFIQEIFDTVGNGRIFSTLDLKSGYWQLEVREEDREKTAFTCHRGHFEFNRVAFGLTNAPAVFQRAMERVLSPVLGRCALVYIDDIVIFSRTTADHLRDLAEVFELLSAANLKLKSTKCEFMKESVELLGYVVSRDGITPTPEKSRAIRELAAPRNLKSLRSFLGLANYYRQCMEAYATVAEPLFELTRKGVDFEWTDRRQAAFDALKGMLVSPAVMAYPDQRKPYRLYTDACGYAIGAILVQTDDDGVERVIQYLSHQLSSVQRRWATIEKEAYAVVFAMTRLRPYLYGAKFKVLTDHKPLKSLFTAEMQNTKIQRWAVLLAEYGAEIEYREGRNNVRADMLSRIESEAAPEECSMITERTTTDWLVDLANDEDDFLLRDGIRKQDLRAAQELEFVELLAQARDPDDDGDYSVGDGVLLTERLPYPGAPDYPRVVLPEQWRDQIIDRAHRDVGHMAARKTRKKVTEGYVWPGLRRDVEARLRLCATCQAYHRRPAHVRMQDIELPQNPMELIGLDFVGPFPEDRSGNRYLLTAIDYHSGWAEAFSVPNQSADSLMDVMTREFFPRHGHPRAIICDNGQGFGSRAWAQFLSDAWVECRHSTPVHPQGNGKVERFNRTFKELMARLVANRPERWAESVAHALTAYRHSVSDVTGFTPFYLLYGRQPRVPLERFIRTTDAPFGNRLDALATAFREAKERTEESRKYNRARLDDRANVATSLQVGDSVTIKAEERLTNTSRWDPQWEVFRVRGTTHWVRHQPTGRERKLHREKLTLVDPAIVWDELPPRPRRNPHRAVRRR